ncbi:hypothetical protein [Streptacidiphilus sp. P02-A3a]|uniref:hypothetical protein n=1 Tax=Streptacidiphilus sp. P02-A3a TaxID=2704468 RepID=UPI0015F8CCDE|nr:hypothetical protein [Streptacidiphilus sp. P02-A3a]QMU66965.1 hypothetical protein GXP74_00765 [Streptacidiphilus sp. P02-A3a]
MPDRATLRRHALAAPAVAVLLALAACSPNTAPTAPTAPGTPGAPPATATAAAPAPSAPPTPSASTGTGGGGSLTAVFSGLGARPVLTPGGPALVFEVSVHNGTGQAYQDIQPLISMGHCSCSPGGASIMPSGTLRLWNTGTDGWRTLTYDAEGTGTDFSYVDQIPGLTLAAGASETFTYQVALSATTHPLTSGSGTVNVQVQQLPGHTALTPDVSTPVYVTP